MAKIRHNRKAVPMPARTGKKEQEREARIMAARQRCRLPKFVALASILIDKWRKNNALQDDIASLPANERRFYAMQLAKVDKQLAKVVKLLFTEKPRPGSPMMRDASDLLLCLLQAVCSAKKMPETCMHMDVHAVVTYLVYVALHEWQAMECDDPDSMASRKEVQDMITQLRIFCDHAIKSDSALIPALNDVYCATRNTLHSGAPLPHYEGVPEVEVA